MIKLRMITFGVVLLNNNFVIIIYFVNLNIINAINNYVFMFQLLQTDATVLASQTEAETNI